jgi:pimeloyl-ACP methyl ester carboxylesterase
MMSEPGRTASFAPVKQTNAGGLDVGYVEAGPENGQPVVLLHGWPYDIHSYADVTPALASAGYRVVVPHLRGFGTTRFLSDDTMRNGQQSVSAVDTIALMDACGIESAIVAGFDWGARTANVVAALWPDRCKAMVAVSGYLIGNPEANKTPLPPASELAWWYQYYFATERGRSGYDNYRHEIRAADLAYCLAEVGLRRHDVRSQCRLLRPPRSRRHRHRQLPLAAWPRSR